MKLFFQYVSFPCLLLLSQACSNNSKPLTDHSKQDTLLRPYVIPLDSVKTVITPLDKAIKPKVISFRLPKTDLLKDQDSHSVVQAIKGKSRFTNFTMADGLGLNTVISATLDHYGNLWFGHDGAGATRTTVKHLQHLPKRRAWPAIMSTVLPKINSGTCFSLPKVPW
jgi:hypothetical protein